MVESSSDESHEQTFLDVLDRDFVLEVQSMTSDEFEDSDPEDQGQSNNDQAKRSRKRNRSEAMLDSFEKLTGSRPDSITDPETGTKIPDYMIGSVQGPWATNTIKIRQNTKALSEAKSDYQKASRKDLEVK